MLTSYRYGLELARLEQAQRESKSAYDIGRRGSVSAAVLQDAKVRGEHLSAGFLLTRLFSLC